MGWQIGSAPSRDIMAQDHERLRLPQADNGSLDQIRRCLGSGWETRQVEPLIGISWVAPHGMTSTGVDHDLLTR